MRCYLEQQTGTTHRSYITFPRGSRSACGILLAVLSTPDWVSDDLRMGWARLLTDLDQLPDRDVLLSVVAADANQTFAFCHDCLTALKHEEKSNAA